MKVLHLLSSNKFSGAENVACQIINMFKNEIEMIYCSPRGQIEESLADKDIQYVSINKLSIKEIKKIIKEYRPDIIHAHDVRASIMAVLSTKRIPVISHIHGNFGNTNKNNSKSILYRLFLSRFSKIIAVSDSVVNEYMFSNELRKKSIILYNVIDVEMILDKIKMDNNEYDFDCVFLGRLTYPKNPERLVSIMKNVAEKNPKIKLGIIGDGELRDTVINLIKKENMDGNIKMMGFIDNPYKILSQSKLMIMCSRYEGTPIAALEAMALGIPIVSTPIDGMIKIIEDGFNGFLSNENEIIAKYINDIIFDDNLKERLSINSICKARGICNVEKYKKIIRNMYQEI